MFQSLDQREGNHHHHCNDNGV